MELNDTFGLDKYTEYREFAVKNGFTIEEIEPKDGERQFKVVEIVNEERELTYAEKRAAEYPEIGEQLDMIYWDKVNGTTLWQDTIAGIKAKYPKPESEE